MVFTRHSKIDPARETQKPNASADDTARISKAFEVSSDYSNGRLHRLREFYSGEWWLNVDYVEEYERATA